MKAVKLTNIIWNLDSVNKDQRDAVLATLPKYKGFMAADEFNVVENVPRILKKKFGYEIFTYSYVELRVVENVEDLLYLTLAKGEKVKKLFVKNGELSVFGDDLVKRLTNNIKRRLQMESIGTPEDKMPSLLDEIMLGVQNITGLKWEDGHTVNEIMSPIMSKIYDLNAVNLKDDIEKEEEEEEDYDDEYVEED